MPIHITYYKTDFGELIIGAYEGKLCLCDWRYRKMRNRIDERIQKGLNSNYVLQEDEITTLTIQQLAAYFQNIRTLFDIPLLFVGTDFQKTVWQSLLQISYGETTTYLQLATQLHNKEAIRAVAAANGANAISIIVPCHRVIGSNGALIGYAGGLNAKQQLLELEGVNTAIINTQQFSLGF
jgi:methylated-DNA-[protein]-cysteine S-methyltransferase